MYQYIRRLKMKKQTALKTLFWLSLAGVLFSGYLSYTEIFQQVCGLGVFGTCGTKIFTLPSCVYGLVMYLAGLIVSVLGLRSK
jgi:uncharacterized membrane protein